MRLDIVIPAHNEEHRIGSTLAAYRAGCADPDCRFLVGLDNCTDATGEIVDAHAQQDARVEKFEYPKLGKGGVIMETFRHCHADLVAFVDADCATLPNEMLRLAQTAAQFDGAIASRRHPAALLPARRSLPRRLTSAGFAYGVKRIFGLPFTDTQCGAKVLKRDVVERVLPLLSSRDLVFDVDLLLTLRALGYRVVEVPTIWIDRDGSRVHAAADAKRMTLSLFRLWLHHRVLPVEPTGAPAARQEGDRESTEELVTHGSP